MIDISRGENLSNINLKILENENKLNTSIYKSILILFNQFYKPVNYGKFKITINSNFIDILRVITDKSNVNYKLTIVEGWERYQLNQYLSNYYLQNTSIPYNLLIADTYLINSSNSFEDLKKFLKNEKNNFMDKYKNEKIFKEYEMEELFIISSLVEKEAKNIIDKPLISSVIFNRLERNMKLQIDATVISAITEGMYKLERDLYLSDLKYEHKLNTYTFKGLPSEMISYIGKETIEIVIQKPKSDYLFYFYDVLKEQHIFSNNYKQHIKRLNEYRKKNK